MHEDQRCLDAGVVTLVTRNPVTTAGTLVEELQQALAQLPLAVVRKQELEVLCGTARTLLETLRHFNDEYVPLELASGSSPLDDALRTWEALEPGVLQAGDPAFERLVRVSPCLQRLHRAGITIRSIKKYSPQEIAFATTLGDQFAELSKPWEDVKRRLTSARFHRGAIGAVRSFLSALENLDVLSAEGFEVAVFRGANRTWEPIDEGRLPRYEDKKLMRVKLKTGPKAGQPLVTGEWLNAYAANLVHDHLERNQISHEVYTNVAYKAPPDIINVSGDFDVMVQAAGRAAAFECKSGRLDATRGDYEQIVQKADGLHKVFDLTQAEVPLDTFLLFNPGSTEADEAAKALEGTRVVPVTPEQVRGTVRGLFGSLGSA